MKQVIIYFKCSIIIYIFYLKVEYTENLITENLVIKDYKNAFNNA